MAFTEGFWVADMAGTVANMNACLLGWGPKVDFPAAVAGNKGRMAWASDENKLYYSTGAAWILLPFSVISEGSYSGIDSANRAIAHGLVVAPKAIFITPRTTGYNLLVGLRAQAQLNSATGVWVVTAPDATNFYVGNATSYPNSGNGSGITYDWVAFT